MRLNHPGAFPFRWMPYTAPGVLPLPPENPATCEPLELTWAEAIELWWRVQSCNLIFSIGATYKTVAQTISQTLDARREIRGGSEPTGYSSGDFYPFAAPYLAERWLCFPGMEVTWDSGIDCRFPGYYSAFTTWGVAPDSIDAFAFTGLPAFFATAESTSDSGFVRRGSIETTAPRTISPAMLFSGSVTWTTGTGEVISLDFSTRPLLGTYDSTSTMNATILGTTVSVNLGLFLDGVAPADFSLDYTSLTLTRKTYFPYAIPDGTEPIWNATTGDLMPGRSPFEI